jgi:hypothetical protein
MLFTSQNTGRNCKTMRKVGVAHSWFLFILFKLFHRNTGRWKSDKAAQETTIYFNFPSKLTRSFPETHAKFNISTP